MLQNNETYQHIQVQTIYTRPIGHIRYLTYLHYNLYVRLRSVLFYKKIHAVSSKRIH